MIARCLSDEAFNVRTHDFDNNGNFKLEVLEDKHNANLNETCLHFNISTPSMVWNWDKKFAKEGVPE